jgi:hypothetical protein
MDQMEKVYLATAERLARIMREVVRFPRDDAMAGTRDHLHDAISDLLCGAGYLRDDADELVRHAAGRGTTIAAAIVHLGAQTAREMDSV